MLSPYYGIDTFISEITVHIMVIHWFIPTYSNSVFIVCVNVYIGDLNVFFS